MDGPEGIWLNPVMELPPAIGGVIIALIAIAAITNVRAGILLLIATVPLQRFVVIPGFLGDRFTPHEAAFVSLIASAILRRGSGIRLTPPWTGPIAGPMLFLLSVGVVSLLGNPFIDIGISEMIIIAYVYLLMHITYDCARQPADALYVYKCWYFTGAAFALLAGYGAFMHVIGVQTFLMDGPRLIATFFNPNQTGSFIVATGFMFLTRVTNPRAPRLRRLANLGLVAALILGGYFTASRATVLGASGGLLVFLVLRRVRLSAIVAIAAMLLAGRFALSAFQKSDEVEAQNYGNRYSEGIDPESQSAQVRMDNWRTGIDAFSRSPVVGVGIGTLCLQNQTGSEMAYQVHNTYLSFLGETGLLGFLAIIAIVLIAVRESFLAIRAARGSPFEDPLAALIPALVALGIFNIFHYGIRARHLWLTMALIFAFRRVATQMRATAVRVPRPIARPPALGPVLANLAPKN